MSYFRNPKSELGYVKNVRNSTNITQSLILFYFRSLSVIKIYIQNYMIYLSFISLYANLYGRYRANNFSKNKK